MKAYLWIIDLAFATRLHHGGLLRYFNLSRELVAQGNKVTFLVCFEDDDREKSIEWMETLRAEAIFTDYRELAIPSALKQWRKLATFLLPVGLHNIAIRRFVEYTKRSTEVLLEEISPDIVIISSRKLLFVAPEFRLKRPSIGDFSDSIALYFWRELRNSFRLRHVRLVIQHARGLYRFFFLEMYTSRKYAANMVVSQVDKRVFDFLGNAEKNLCIMNGVRGGPDSRSVSKIPNQIVFSGAMSFPPNHDGAIWFLDNVFPAVLKRAPQITFVIAGANPPDVLLSRAGPNVKVLGYVDDLNKVLAESALYVAPLITGSGFKNKVAEAIINGTYVVGTTLAVEFLEPSMRELIIVRDDPQGMADAICEFFLEPEKVDSNMRQLRQFVKERFSWPAKAKELADLADSMLNRAIR